MPSNYAANVCVDHIFFSCSAVQIIGNDFKKWIAKGFELLVEYTTVLCDPL